MNPPPIVAYRQPIDTCRWLLQQDNILSIYPYDGSNGTIIFVLTFEPHSLTRVALWHYKLDTFHNHISHPKYCTSYDPTSDDHLRYNDVNLEYLLKQTSNPNHQQIIRDAIELSKNLSGIKYDNDQIADWLDKEEREELIHDPKNADYFFGSLPKNFIEKVHTSSMSL